ncbi:MAG: hypothetical protein V4760_13630 [Bdellovibrionota bacterium]
MSKKFRNYFIGELIVIGAVVLVFKLVSERLVAGAVAGTFFVALGIWIASSGWSDRGFRRTPTFIVALVHLFASALPLMITRFMNSASVFDDVRVLGLPGPVFHRVSTAVYLLLMAATVFDWVRSARSGVGSSRV